MGLSTYPPLQRLDPHRIVVRVITMVIENAMSSTASELQPDDMGGHVVTFLEAARQEIAHAAAAILNSSTGTSSVSAMLLCQCEGR
jgi:hypothetical protein